MTCTEYQFWIESQTDLSSAEQRDLERHLAVCADCRRVAQTMQSYEIGIKALQQITLTETDENAVEAIIGAAKMTSRLRPVKQRMWVEQLVNMITEPVFRFATAALIVLTLGLFGFQEVYTVHQLNQLAESMAQRGRSMHVQTKYFWEDMKWRSKVEHWSSGTQGATIISSHFLWPELYQRLTALPQFAKPLAWRIRLGNTSSAGLEKIWYRLQR